MKVLEQGAAKNLFYREGSSDKVYQVQLTSQDSGWVVNFQYGRRGNTLMAGTKTAKPVTYDKASKIYESLITEKERKGYTEDSKGIVFSGAVTESRKTGLIPQLLNPVDEEDVMELVRDDTYWMQPKHDGKRIMVGKAFGEVTASNRKGLSVVIPSNLFNRLQNLEGSWVIDGELIGETYHVFDLLEFNKRNLREEPYSVRYAKLWDFFKENRLPNPNIRPVETAKHKIDKLALFKRLKADGAEGVVFKDKDSVAKPGRPNSRGPQRKFKFVKTLSAVVLTNNPTKRSVSVGVYFGNASDPDYIGNVTIPPNYLIPKVGSIIEVQYLYAYRGGSLYQPVYKGERDDLDCTSCDSGQLQYKEEGSDEEES